MRSGNVATVSILNTEVTALALTWISVPFYQMPLKYLPFNIPVLGLIFPPTSPSFLQHHHSLHHQDRNFVYSRAPSPYSVFLIIKSYWFLPTQSLSDVPLPLYSFSPHKTQASHCSWMIQELMSSLIYIPPWRAHVSQALVQKKKLYIIKNC